jgi:hypothetical protein
MVRHLLFLGLLFAVVYSVADRSSTCDTGSTSGRRFMAIRKFHEWRAERDDRAGEIAYSSPDLAPGIPWNNLVVSWNVEPRPTGYLKFDVQAVYPDRPTKWYSMGQWSGGASPFPRPSVNGQKDADGDVETDTLVLGRPVERLETPHNGRWRGRFGSLPPRFLGLSFLDTGAAVSEDRPHRAAWGRVLDVPERTQLICPEGKKWCSPTCTAMVLAYWSGKLKRPELNCETAAVAAGVNDPNWPGTGNWAFNAAYAGSFPGMRAYVGRLGSLGELEQWIAAGVPVVCSISYRLLHGKDGAESGGHIVVCRGFTKTGDVVVNEPWAELDRGDSVKITVPRSAMAAAWAHSNNTAYLIYPERWRTPTSRRQHWDASGASVIP